MAKSAVKRGKSVSYGQRSPGRVFLAVVTAAAVAGAVFYFFFRGEDQPAPTAEEVLQTQRYCALSVELDSALFSIGVPAGGVVPPDVRPEAVNQVLSRLGPGSEELEVVAPSKIREDVKVVLGALRRVGAGDSSATQSSAFIAAQGRIGAYRQETAGNPTRGCPEGAGSGDG